MHVAVGGFKNDANGLSNAGHVRVYEIKASKIKTTETILKILLSDAQQKYDSIVPNDTEKKL